MKLLLATLLALTIFSISGCDSETKERPRSGETVIVDGTEVAVEDIQQLMNQTGMDAEEAREFLRENLVKENETSE